MARTLWCLATLTAAAPLPWCPEGSLVSLADRMRDGCAGRLPPPWADPASASAAWSALQVDCDAARIAEERRRIARAAVQC